jgi:hypothetical protein
MTSMLEYVKMILVKVSFDRFLFEKELRKAINRLLEAEVSELRNWCYEKFGQRHAPALQRCFG